MPQATLVGFGRGIASDGEISSATRQIAEKMAAISSEVNRYKHVIASGGYSCRMAQPPRLAREAIGMYRVFGLAGGEALFFNLEVQSLDSIGNFVLVAYHWPDLVMVEPVPVEIACAARFARRARWLARRIWGRSTSGRNKMVTIIPVHIDQPWRDSAHEIVIEWVALAVNWWQLRGIKSGDINGALERLKQRPEYADLDVNQIA